MERDNDDPSAPECHDWATCPSCRGIVKNVDCQCPRSPGASCQVAAIALPETSMDQLLNGASLHTHTKSNVSNVPESIVRFTPSSDTKTKDCSKEETKLLLSKVNIGNECLNYDKEAVNVGTSSKVGSESNIFEIDFDCVDSTMVIRNASSHKVGDKQSAQERTPMKGYRPAGVPSAPQKQPVKTTEDHREYSTRAPRHACPYCSKTFRSNGKLNSHVFTHTGERPFACKHCQKAFSSKFKLVRHLLIHSEERKFLCTVCERRFLRNDHLKNHYKVHDPRKVLFRCSRSGCEKEYSSAMSQRKHEAWHRAQDGDLTCLLCRVKHETVADLLIHLRRHSGSRMLKSPADRKFRCHVCERHFLTRKDVTRHLVVHTGERDFLCQFCPQRFGRKDHLIRHIKKSHHANNKKKGKHSKWVDAEEVNESDTGAAEGDEEDEDDPEENVAVDEGSLNLSEPELADLDGERDCTLPSPAVDNNYLMENSSPTQEDCSYVLQKPASPDIEETYILPKNSPLSDTDEIDTGESQDKVPRDLEEIQTSELIMRDSPQCSFTAAIISESPATTARSDLPAIANEILNPQPTMNLFFQSPEVNFDAVSVTTCDMLTTASENVIDDKRDGELFEGSSQRLMFGEPSFDEEEYKSTDFLLSQGQSSGELLRFLLESDPAAPLPGFSQAFNNNSGSPNS